MIVSEWLVIILGALLGGWLLFDGSRALISGDFITPQKGPYAKQLGKWSFVLLQVGIKPRSNFVKWLHVVLGLIWIICIMGFLIKFDWAWWGIFFCAIASLWYAPFGTIISIIEIVLLFQ